MRKNLLFGLFATMVLLLTTACQKENDLLGNGEATISFEISTPQMATRAFSDGNTAKKLQYAVYDENGAFIGRLSPNADEFKPVEITDFNGKRTINIQLAAGKTYYVLFWASALNSPYSVDYKTKTLSVDYANTVCNSDANDAFYCYKKVTVDATKSEPVTLKRPFAQLNIGTNDLSVKNEVDVTKTGVKVKGIYNTFNLAENVLGGDINTEYTFALAARPEGETFKVDGYEYLAMAYVLVGNDKNYVTDVKLCYGASAETAKTREFTNIPVRGNHRTNLYGALLTNNIGFDVEIEEDFDEPDENLYYVSVDGVHYTDFAEAVAIALAQNKPIDFITDVKIDADNTITVPEGQTLTLNLNGQTLYGETDDADKNDDNKITSADNEVMFDVRGTMNVNGGTVGIKHVGESYKDFGWNACGEVFYVGFNGELNVENATIENYGGVPMAYAIDMVNASVTRAAEAGIYVNVDNSTIKSSYIPVRVFNNGAGMNNVTIENTTLEGTSRAFWVHIYTQADDATFFKNGKDTNGNGYKDETLNINIYNPTCHNTFIADNAERIIEYGFTNEINLREDGSKIIVDAEGNVVEGIGMDMDGNYAVSAAAGLEYLSTLVAADDNNFEGKTVKLAADIDLTDVKTNGDSFAPIGSTGERDGRNRLICEPFKGTFDGQDHTIKGIYQSGWDMGYDYDNYGSIGLFSVLEGATVKNIVIDGLHAEIERGDISFIAGSATGTCVFENITIKNSSIGTFDNGNGGIIGWSGDGSYTFKNITLESDVVIGGLWGSFDQSCGGIVGQAEPGATYNFENVTISCRLDVFNDVTASWQYYLYRMCGMIIGRCEETTTINGVNYPDLSKYNMTFNNVVVNYGDWMNYHYCHGPYGMKDNAGRVEPGIAYGGLDINATDHNGTCTEHMQLIPFDQLIGGDQIGVRGLREVNGVTVNYPASYRREVSSAAALTEALGKGVSVILDTDIDFGSTQLAITGENQVVDLGGHALTTANNWGGISLKNGATIKNGTITHAGNTAAIKAFNGSSVENVTINATCSTADKTVTGIAVQQGANVESIKNVTINGVSQGIEVGYQATVGLIENAVVNESNNGTAKGIGLVINGGKVGKAKNCTFKGETYGVTLHLKGVFAAGLDLENCKVEGTTASIYAWDEKGISNTSGSLVLTYDAATILTGPFVWDFEDECKSVVTLNKPE